MKILFIGGTGRLSKDAAKKAADDGHEVFLLTRGSQNRKLFVDERYHMIYADITQEEDCRKKLQDCSFDVVIDFLTLEERQLKRTLSIIEGKYSRYIFISSATVYEIRDNEPVSEETAAVGNTKYAYAHNKYVCERYLEEYFRSRNAAYTIVRPYVTYGNTRVPYPLVPRNALLEWSFVQRIIDGRPIPTFLEGKTVTTLTHTKDFAAALIGLCVNPEAENEAVHITNEKTSTWAEVLDDLEEILSVKSNRMDFTVAQIIHALPEYEGVLKGDKARNSVFDDTKIKRLVPGFSCKVSLKEGLADMIAFYREHPKMQLIDYEWMGKIDRLCGVGNVLGTYGNLDRNSRRAYKRGYYFRNYTSRMNRIQSLMIMRAFRRGLSLIGIKI